MAEAAGSGDLRCTGEPLRCKYFKIFCNNNCVVLKVVLSVLIIPFVSHLDNYNMPKIMIPNVKHSFF